MMRCCKIPLKQRTFVACRSLKNLNVTSSVCIDLNKLVVCMYVCMHKLKFSSLGRIFLPLTVKCDSMPFRYGKFRNKKKFEEQLEHICCT